MVEFGNNEKGLHVDDDERKARREIVKKRSTAGLEQKWQHEDREELEEAERMMAPPTVVEPRCHVCSGPFAQYRFWIERQLVKGRSHQSIAANIPADPQTGRKLDRRSIGRHSREHMQLDQAVTRALMEDEATLIQQNVEEGVRGAWTQRGALEVLVRKGWQDAYDGITTVEVRDLIQMMKLYKEMQTDSGSMAMEEAKLVVRIFMDAIKNVLIHGDLVDSEIGKEITIAIAAEVKHLREVETIEASLESNLALLSPPDAIPDFDR